MNPHNTILLNWNANGLKNKWNTLLAFLTHHNIDIACITETHLSSLDKIKFPGYILHRVDRITQLHHHELCAELLFLFVPKLNNKKFLI